MLSNRLFCFSVAAGLAVAGDSGVSPRPNTADYAAHHTTDSVTMAASIVPADQVRKIFSPDIAKDYVVVECAFYPLNGHSVDVDRFGFSLKTGPDSVAHAETPRDVAAPWPEKRNPLDKSADVTTETGVYVARTSVPGYGHQTETGAWQGVAVGDGDRRNAPPPPPDRPGLEGKLRDRALPEGSTGVAVAGYLYFPRYAKKHKNDATELNYSKDDLTLDLTFPK
jgi:hypothetical protein